MQYWYEEFKKTAVLAFPIVLSQVAQHMIQVIDSAMIGRVGVVPLAAAAFASNLFTIPLVFSYGITVTTSILTSASVGSGDIKKAHHVLRVGLLLSAIIGTLLATGFFLGKDILNHFGQTEDVIREAKPYFSLLMWSIIPALIFSCFKNFSEAFNRPWMPFVILLFMLVSNVFFNWVLIFGKLGFPAMGLVGAGWGTVFARSLSVILVILVVGFGKSWSFRILSKDWLHIGKKDIWKYLSIGIPSGLQIIFEVSAFVLAAIMMGWIGEIALASHQIAMNVAATSFMICLGVSFATSVRVGQSFGRKDFSAMRRSGIVGWGINAAIMVTCMLLFLLLRNVIPTWFVSEIKVIELAATLLIVAGLFQVFDGIQISMVSALRGMQDVKTPTLLILFVYYGICLPLAYFLGFKMKWEGVGIWTGLAVGLGLSALVLSLRFHIKTKHLIAQA